MHQPSQTVYFKTINDTIVIDHSIYLVHWLSTFNLKKKLLYLTSFLRLKSKQYFNIKGERKSLGIINWLILDQWSQSNFNSSTNDITWSVFKQSFEINSIINLSLNQILLYVLYLIHITFKLFILISMLNLLIKLFFFLSFFLSFFC